jgi:hypothetical protein
LRPSQRVERRRGRRRDGFRDADYELSRAVHRNVGELDDVQRGAIERVFGGATSSGLELGGEGLVDRG